MTRLTIRRGGTRRLRATLYADLAAGTRRDLTGLTVLVVDQSPNIAAPAVSIRARQGRVRSSGGLECFYHRGNHAGIGTARNLYRYAVNLQFHRSR
jgi:hypothetical protein